MAMNLEHTCKLGPEETILIYCSRAEMGPSVKNTIIKNISRGLDWGRLEHICSAHGLAPVVNKRIIEEFRDFIPGTIIANLRQSYFTDFRRNAILTQRLLRVLEMMEEQSIKAMPLKGPILAHELYGHISMRLFGDLDILTPSDQFDQATKTLFDDGWTCPYESDAPKLNRARNEKYREVMFLSPDGRVALELHREVGYDHFLSGFSSELLWLDPVKIPYSNHMILSPKPEALLIYLCAHAASHGWQRLMWVSDVDRLIRSKPDLDWDMIVKESEDRNCLRAVYLGVLLAAWTMETPGPERIIFKAKRNPRIKSLSQSICRLMFKPINPTENKLRIFYFRFRLIEKPLHGPLYLFHLLARPPRKDPLLEMPMEAAFLQFMVRLSRKVFRSLGVKKLLRSFSLNAL